MTSLFRVFGEHDKKVPEDIETLSRYLDDEQVKIFRSIDILIE